MVDECAHEMFYVCTLGAKKVKGIVHIFGVRYSQLNNRERHEKIKIK